MDDNEHYTEEDLTNIYRESDDIEDNIMVKSILAYEINNGDLVFKIELKNGAID